MRKNNQQSIGEVLQEIIAAYRLKPQMNQAKLAAEWEKLMGKTIARHTTSLSCKEGVLQINISSAPLRNELFYQREQIKQHLNQALGDDFLKEVTIK
jgi:predicted nucleic acid-binding Zn ribbon protein